MAKADAREIMTAAALLLVLGSAELMHKAGLSAALGAFIAGVMLADSPYRHELEADVDPFRSILLGLEFLIAADIINTVAVTPTLQSVIVLGAIVIIRTFLSFSLELEIDGRWPWQRRADEKRKS